MSEFSLKDILLLVFGGGVITGLVALGKVVYERLDQARKEKKELSETHTSLSIESRRIDLTENEQIIENWREFAVEKKKEIEILKLEIQHFKDVVQQIETHNSLSRPTITKLYGAVNILRKRIIKVDTLIEEANCEHTTEDLCDEIEKLKAAFTELESLLP